jgi:hypothetical protein
MTPYGSDRIRTAGDKVILHCGRPKGWIPRSPPSGTHKEHPGTAVRWQDSYWEVVTAEGLQNGAVRYVLAPWRDDLVMRNVEPYSAESEAALADEYERVARQNRHGLAARLGTLLTGHLPAPVQNKLGMDLGISAAAMTLASCVLPVVFVGVCVYEYAGSRLEKAASPIPVWLWGIAVLFLLESGVRFFVAMTQNRPMGSLAGFIAYLLFWSLGDRRALPSPFTERGDGLFMLDPSSEIELRDALETRGPLLALLPAEDQRRLEREFGFDYRRNAMPLAWAFLAFSLAGTYTSWRSLQGGGGFGSFVSLLAAGGLAAEQVYRLAVLRARPAGSVLALFVRPFVRRFLERR